MERFVTDYEVFAEAKRGGRNYMEDVVCVKVPQDDGDGGERGPADGGNGGGGPLRLYLAVFDGHGGPEAAEYAKDHLLDEITKQKGFWTDDDDQVVRAIKDGFLSTHKLMWTVVDKWAKTASGLQSTAGTTASAVFVKGKKMYVAHVGDSSVVLGRKLDNREEWLASTVTKEHKPDAPEELQRIQSVGGQVMSKAGIARVVWKRPRVAKGPVRRSTVIDNVPFLAIARSLGDLWSYNAEQDVFVVSPEPDVFVADLEDSDHQCVILASDGVWNMIKADEAMRIVSSWYQNRKGTDGEAHAASVLVDLALERWQKRQIRADNTSAIVAFLNRDDNSNSHSRSECENGVAEIIEDPRKPSSKSRFLPLQQNFLSVLAAERTPGSSCKIGNANRMHLSKEDRHGSKWRKMRRKSLHGYRIRFLSVGSGDDGKKVKRRRHTLPSVKNSGSFDSLCTLYDGRSSYVSRYFGMDSECKNPAEFRIKSNKDVLEMVGKLDSPVLKSVGCDSSDDILCFERLKRSDHFDAASSSRKALSLPVLEPLPAADGSRKTVTDFSAGLDSVSNLLNLNKISSPEHGTLLSSTSLKRVGSVYCKRRRRSEAGVLPEKRPCLDLSPDSCRSYRTHFQNRLRIPVE